MVSATMVDRVRSTAGMATIGSMFSLRLGRSIEKTYRV